MASADNIANMLAHGESAIPSWATSTEREREVLKAAAEIFADLWERAEDLFGNGYVGTAIGATSVTPDWLALHASDRLTSRQSGESDAALVERLHDLANAVTISVLVAIAQALVDESGTPGTVGYYESAYDGAYLTTWANESGTGGTISGTAPDMVFTPDDAIDKPPVISGDRPNGSWHSTDLVLSGFTGANNGTFAVTGVSGNGVTFTNASGTAEVAPSGSWELDKLSQAGDSLDGVADTFCGGGHRAQHRSGGFVLIVPYTTPDATVAAIIEAVRLKKLCGVLASVERRETAP